MLKAAEAIVGVEHLSWYEAFESKLEIVAEPQLLGTVRCIVSLLDPILL